MRLVEHWGLFEFGLLLAIAPVLDTQTVLQVTDHPHLTHDILIEGEICSFEELDQEARACKGISASTCNAAAYSPRAMTTETRTAVQKVSSPNRITTSSTKSILSNREYMAIQANMTTDEPMMTTHVMTVQLNTNQLSTRRAHTVSEKAY